MFSGTSRTVLLAGLLASALALPALAADIDAVKEEATQSDQPMVMAASVATQPSAGPVVARESLGADQVAVEGGAEQTRSAASWAALKRIRAARAARAASYSGNGNGYRSSTPIMLGVRF